jgi:hypothetical protein
VGSFHFSVKRKVIAGISANGQPSQITNQVRSCVSLEIGARKKPTM